MYAFTLPLAQMSKTMVMSQRNELVITKQFAKNSVSDPKL